VLTCETPSEALDCYRNAWRRIDLVIMDMMMPGMTGRDLFLAMQAINPEIRVILASGHTMNGEVQNILQLGARAFLQKPYSNTEFASTVAKVLQSGR
jgi:two-component system cell cycle sensor histidine kinase/response regulator CckA